MTTFKKTGAPVEDHLNCFLKYEAQSSVTAPVRGSTNLGFKAKTQFVKNKSGSKFQLGSTSLNKSDSKAPNLKLTVL